MLYRPLGRTGLSVSEIGFGCASWWAKAAFDEREAQALVHAALDLGITLFDTGASYGAGQAEARLGRALAGRETAKLVIATKAGTYADARGRVRRDMGPAAVRASAERSLGRLGLESLPILQLHGPAIHELTPELIAALQALKAEGTVRALGVNSFDPAVIEHVIGRREFDLVMIDFNLLRPERTPLIRRAAAAGKGVLAGMPLAMGHVGLKVASLKGPQDLWYAARGLVRHRREVLAGARFGFLRQLPGMSASQAALAYVLAEPGVSAAVVGTTRAAHLAEDAAASGIVLPPDLMSRIVKAQSGLG